MAADASAGRIVSGSPRTDPQSADERQAELAMRSGPGGWFVQTGCFVCHSISVFSVKSPAQIGPDLSTAVDDVQKRFGLTLDAFLANPTGTMSVVLSRQIILTPAQKEIAISKLREAFAEYQRQQAAGEAQPQQRTSGSEIHSGSGDLLSWKEWLCSDVLVVG